MTGKTNNQETADSAAQSLGDKLTNLKISTKISGGFGCLLVIMALMSALTYFGIAEINEDFQQLHRRNLVVDSVRNMERDLLNMRRQVLEFSFTGTETSLTRARAAQNVLQGSIDRVASIADEPALIPALKTIKDDFSAYATELDKLVEVRHEQDSQFNSVLATAGPNMYVPADQLENWAISTGDIGNLSIASTIMKQIMMARFQVNKFFGRHDQQSIAAANKAFVDIKAAVALFRMQVTDEAMLKRVAIIESEAAAYQKSFDLSIKYDRATTEITLHHMVDIAKNFSEQVKAIVESQKAEESRTQNDMAALIQRVKLITVALALGGLALGTLLAWKISRAISKPVNEITHVMTLIAGGDLAAEIPGRDRTDEIGEMAQAVLVFQNAAIEKIARDKEHEAERIRNEEERRRGQAEAIEQERGTVARSLGAAMARLAAKDLTFRLTEEMPDAYRKLQGDLNDALNELEAALSGVVERSDLIGSGTREISAAADDLSRRTEQQAASLEETAAALEEITATVSKTAQGATQAADIVSSTKTDAEKSSAIVLQAIEAMSNIESSSQEISQIISVIDEIAFQTNLLALNAGVEAARAGEAGRGFAVVASEVRALAQRSAEAAKEIKTLIFNSSAHVSRGVDLVGQTGKSLERIVHGIAEVNRVAIEIASGAHEQATSLREINSAVTQMDEVTQRNAAMVEETTAASRNLRQETEDLLATVAHFHVGQSGRSAAVQPAAARKAAATRPVLKAVSSSGAAVRKSEPARDWEEF